jgi:hypothetical protein
MTIGRMVKRAFQHPADDASGPPQDHHGQQEAAHRHPELRENPGKGRFTSLDAPKHKQSTPLATSHIHTDTHAEALYAEGLSGLNNRHLIFNLTP